MCDRGILVLAECFANKCIASKQVDFLKEHLGATSKCFEIIGPEHLRKYGRDRVLKKTISICRKRTMLKTEYKHDIAIVLSFIDSERGLSKYFLEENAKFLCDCKDSGHPISVSLARAKQCEHAFYVVFEPDIENALLKPLGMDVESLKTKIKSSKACVYIEEHMRRSQSANNILKSLARCICRCLSEYLEEEFLRS